VGYNGPCIRVRRSSDNAEKDIGFSGGTLDTQALTDFANGGDVYVVTWYDQSGNNRDATQSTQANQPQIVSSGSVITEAGEPAIDGNGSSELVQNNYDLSLPLTVLYVSAPIGNGAIFGKRGGGHFEFQEEKTVRFDGSNKNQSYTAPSIPIVGVATETSNGGGFHQDGSVVYDSVTALSSLPAGDGYGVFNRNDSSTDTPLDGTIGEVILWPKKLDRKEISDKVNSHYSIY
jgi:hypothetical protein